MTQPKLLIFASGSRSGGGSGFENLVLRAREGVLDADIVGVVSNHADGGVRERADRLGIRFMHFASPWVHERYHEISDETGAEFFALSGWLKHVSGLDPRRTFNIHPGPLPEFGGAGLYGHHVHHAVMEAHGRGAAEASAVTMHFVSDEYDRGPVFFRFHVPIEPGDTVETLGARVLRFEHLWQPEITNLVLSGAISWDGSDPESLRVPSGYEIDRYDHPASPARSNTA
ncbi:phosphoribosylglycinamide formyltransferase-1 [Faunimonas pinastri]|uniref:phosphoribosylglycinamide formyltransferase 1 n=1 Tax=Faunimonas pinastri TaxID=1855383 RepID=A0A1H9N9H1_9HYPH|nr:formyltransferase family protein [Faunimonas pinastri]SER32562.1 phosphoribosylglycinamide formyltransferase-1 [Faunimonas pinastri]